MGMTARVSNRQLPLFLEALPWPVERPRSDAFEAEFMPVFIAKIKEEIQAVFDF